MSFNSPRSLTLVQRFQEIDARRHFEAHQSKEYGIPDTDVWGILRPEYQTIQKALWEVMREHEQGLDARIETDAQSPADYEPMVLEMERLLAPYLKDNRALNPYTLQNQKEVSC